MRPASVKVFVLSASLLLAGAAVPVRADDNSRKPISREWIMDALISSGVQIAPQQLEPLSSMTAAVANPRLKVMSVEVLDGESDLARLQCERVNTCLPFYVLVHWGQPGDVQPAPFRPPQRKTGPLRLAAGGNAGAKRKGRGSCFYR